jgi:hypothetical protein
MQRFILLLLAVSLGVSIFVCSQQGIQQPVSESDMARVTQKDIEPFYYVALPYQGPYENEELVRERFIEELNRQNISITDTVLFFYYNDPTAVAVNKLQWAIVAPLRDSVHVKYPLTISKWNFKKILAYHLDESRQNNKLIDRIFKKYLVQKRLQSDSSIIEIIYSNFSTTPINRERWCPIMLESD